MSRYSHYLYGWFESMGISSLSSKYLNMICLFVIVLGFALLLDYITKILIRKISSKIALRSQTKLDDMLIENRLPSNFAHVVPVLFFKLCIPIVFTDFIKVENIFSKIVSVLTIVLILRIVRSILNTAKDFLKTKEQFKDKPIDSYIQVFMIFAWFTGFVYSFTILADMEVLHFLTAMGAVSAVIILVFKDTILGFVASIQVSINDMVRIGDWITFSKYGADGDVVEINLATVKVQNFDNTITTIPTYALISDSFKNWRGMVDSGGRRIKRAIHIRQDTIRFLTDADMVRLAEIEILSDYMKLKKKEIADYNKDNEVNKSVGLNGRNLTNIGVFRKYIELYLNNHSAINKDMMIMARQLQPTNLGIPLEIYAFSKDKRWENYEYITSDIFDHLLSAINYFEMEVFESPNSKSFK